MVLYITTTLVNQSTALPQIQGFADPRLAVQLSPWLPTRMAS